MEAALNLRLERVPQRSGRPIHDYEFGLAEATDAVEVKQVTSADFRQLAEVVGGQRPFASAVLDLRWDILIDGPTLGDRFKPMPNFPEDDERQIAALEAQGFTAQRKADREREHLKRTKQRPPQMRIKDMAKKLEPHLAVLEDAGITCSRTAEGGRPVWLALQSIADLTQGALCLGRKPLEGGSPGVVPQFSWVTVRTTDPDVLAERVELWLGTDESDNLRASLENADAVVRHAALVFDPQTEPEFRAASDPVFVPTRQIDLGDHIDVLWLILGGVGLRYRTEEGWDRFDAV